MGEARGNVTSNQKIAPPPGRSATPIRPFINSTSFLLMLSPSPVPPNRRAIDASACSNGANNLPFASSLTPMPVSRTSMRRRAPPSSASGPCHGDRDAPPLGEFDGVGDEIEEDLTQPRRIAAESPVAQSADLGGQREPLLFGAGLEQFDNALDQGRQIEV